MSDAAGSREAAAQFRGDDGPAFGAAGRDDSGRRPFRAVDRDGETLTEADAVNVAVYERVNRSVVNITTRTVHKDGLFRIDVPEEGAGSGAVLDKRGRILTNYHVVEGARAVSVTLFDGESYDAELVGGDPVNDVAVLRIDAPASSLFPVALGDSSRLKVGMQVFAIGNPFGLERTMTTGIVSSLNRSLQIRGNRTIKSIIQIDAAVNPGNSGGPLLDSSGRLIGVNTAIATSTGQNSGIGFAIPVNLVKRVAPQLIQHGRVIRPEIGVSAIYETEHGLLIARLTPGGPAQRAGLRGPKITRTNRGLFTIERVDRSAADLIVAVDGAPVESTDDFLALIESRNIGDVAKLTIIRDGRRVEVPVRLEGDDRPAPR